ncbi:MAG: hypothetical protein ACE5EG_06535, partial [Thermoanaerobaculia bacterium]
MSTSYELAPRRGTYVDLRGSADEAEAPLSAEELRQFETLDLVYRSLCALMFNYVPTSGHPGGSISSGRIVAGILFDAMDYDLAGRRLSDLVKLDILLNGDPVDALSVIVHKERAYEYGRKVARKL